MSLSVEAAEGVLCWGYRFSGLVAVHVPDSFVPLLFSHARSRDRLVRLAAAADRRGVPCFLTGGAVRGALRGRPAMDFDFALPAEGLDAVAEWAKETAGRHVLLDPETRTARVLFRDGMVADFAPFRAATLVGDLRRRDFTVNAIAVELGPLMREAPLTLLDPAGGREDLARGLIRWASARSLHDDPLRMLRAFRFVAAEGFTIEPNTLRDIAENAPLLRTAARERVREEFFRILSCPRSAAVLRALDGVRLLETFLPELSALKGAPQNEFHHLDVWEHTLEAVRRFEEHPLPDELSDFGADIAAYLDTKVGQGISYRALVKFGLLYHDVAKPETRSEDDFGRVRFFGHERTGAETVHRAARRLRLSNRLCEAVRTLVRQHLRTMHLAATAGERPSRRALRRFLLHTGREWLAVLLLSLADMEAARGPARTESQRRRTRALARELFLLHRAEMSPGTQPQRLLTGNDIKELLRIREGREIGRLLRLLDEAQEAGDVRVREDAVRYVRALHAKATRKNAPDRPRKEDAT